MSYNKSKFYSREAVAGMFEKYTNFDLERPYSGYYSNLRQHIDAMPCTDVRSVADISEALCKWEYVSSVRIALGIELKPESLALYVCVGDLVRRTDEPHREAKVIGRRSNGSIVSEYIDSGTLVWCDSSRLEVYNDCAWVPVKGYEE